jgi:hypothetical protein
MVSLKPLLFIGEALCRASSASIAVCLSSLRVDTTTLNAVDIRVWHTLQSAPNNTLKTPSAYRDGAADAGTAAARPASTACSRACTSRRRSAPAPANHRSHPQEGFMQSTQRNMIPATSTAFDSNISDGEARTNPWVSKAPPRSCTGTPHWVLAAAQCPPHARTPCLPRAPHKTSPRHWRRCVAGSEAAA